MATEKDYTDYMLAEACILQEQIEEDMMTEYHLSFVGELGYDDEYYD